MSVAVNNTVSATISSHRMLSAGDRIIVAVSGGADSVCLLHVLNELAQRLNVTVGGVAHLNHKLRAEESDEDEEFVRALAREYGVKFHRDEANLAGGGNLEQAARRARRAFFARLIKSSVADRIATGHTRDDQAETVLFRLIRGSGPAGLSGILPVTEEGIIRPLLDVTRDEIREYLASRGISWREDSTNLDSKFARNRIRRELLPQLAREWNPQIVEALARFALIAHDEEEWWAEKIGRLAAAAFVAVDGGLEIPAHQLAEVPTAVARRLIRYAIAKTRGDNLGPVFEHIEGVLSLSRQNAGEGTVNLPGLAVIRSFDLLRFRARRPEYRANVQVALPGRYRWGETLVCFDDSETTCEHGICARLKLRGPGELAPLELRSWRAGDHYRPAGKHRDYTLQELFQRARVPSWRRSLWPVVAMGSQIVWVREFGAAHEFAAGEAVLPVLRIWEEKTPNA